MSILGRCWERHHNDLEMLDISLTHAFRHLHDAPSVFHFLLWFQTLEVKSPEETLYKNEWIMFLNWCLHLGARREMHTVNFLDSDTFSSESWVQNLYVCKSFYQSRHQKERMFVFLIVFFFKIHTRYITRKCGSQQNLILVKAEV